MADTRNKRKFDDSGPSISYNRVPPPPSDFEQARQKAMQIAARLSAGVQDPTKRSRPDNDDGYAQDEKTSIFESADRSQSSMGDTRKHKFDDSGSNTLSSVELAKQKAQQILARFTVQDTTRSRPEEEDSYALQDDKPSQVHNPGQFLQSKKNDFGTGSFYSAHGPPESRKVEIPNAKVGLVIGKGGDTIKHIQLQSGARVQITKDMDHNPNVPFRTVELMGTPEQIDRAEQAIHDVIAEADAAAANSSHGTYPPAGEQVQLTVPTNKVGLIIGRGGETIKGLQSRTGARIQLVPLLGPPEYHSGVAERVLTLMGSKEQVDAASELIKELINENRVRGPVIQGGYNPLPGAPQWGPSGGPPMQPQGYGYQQGPYYTGPPQHYGSFPPPPPTGWSQPPPAPPQQYHPPGSYGYYNQQGQMGYEQQALYTEQPPGASQEVYGQQIPGQPEPYGHMGAHQTYGSPDLPPYAPPGVINTTYTHGSSHEGYGPPGVGESAYGQQTSQQGPPGVGQIDHGHQDGEEAQHSSQQGYLQSGSEIEKQSSEYRYDEANVTSYGQQDPLNSHYGPSGPGQQVAGQINYGQGGTGYWSNNSVQYSYNGYEGNQSGYGEQIQEQSGSLYEQQSDKNSNVSYGGKEADGSHLDSCQEKQELRAADHLAYGNGYPYNGQYESDYSKDRTTEGPQAPSAGEADHGSEP
eukprot:c19567_g1_i1 orf=804-2882(-)